MRFPKEVNTLVALLPDAEDGLEVTPARGLSSPQQRANLPSRAEFALSGQFR